MRNLTHRFRSFLHDESGLILVETLIMLPLLIWALVAIFIYWDVFRSINTTQKASYALADLLSRQKTEISLNYANGLQEVLDFLAPGGQTMRLRITSFECINPTGNNTCSTAAGSYRLLFSYSPGSPVNGVLPLTETDIQAWKPRIPILAHKDSVFVVETTVDFKARLQTVLLGMLIGIEDQTFGEFIVTRPRHARLCLEGTNTCT
jgi:hypothetical protein